MTAYNEFYPGNPVLLTGKCYDQNGTLVAATCVIKVKDPATGTLTTVSNSTAVTGIYTGVYTLATDAKYDWWYYSVQFTGAYTSFSEGRFKVIQSQILGNP